MRSRLGDIIADYEEAFDKYQADNTPENEEYLRNARAQYIEFLDFLVVTVDYISQQQH